MIHLNYDGKQNNGIIFNDIYPTGALFIGEELKPALSFEYDSMQYSEVFDTINYVELNGVKKVMTPEQEAEVKAMAITWVQPLGQEGNPNDEQKQLALKQGIQVHIDAEAVSLGFDDINSISKYMVFDNVYKSDADSLANWTIDVWEYVESELVKMQNGDRTIPTLDEAIAELPARV